MVGITYGLRIYKDAQEDISALLKTDKRAAAQIAAFLEELGGDQTLLDSLNLEGYEDERITVKMVVKLQRERWNGWRLTLRDAEPPENNLPYRILYAFDGKTRLYHILAVRKREKDIVYNDETLDRACKACRDLGILPLPGG